MIRICLTAWAVLIVLSTASTLHGEVSDPIAGAEPPAVHREDSEPTEFQLGDHGVAELTGAASYSIPITVPPGRNGMEPKLALRYSSGAPLRGGVAAGWSLDLPNIALDTSAGTTGERRVRANFAGRSGRLLRVNDVTAYGGASYRLEHDGDFTRFEFVAESIRDDYPEGQVIVYGGCPPFDTDCIDKPPPDVDPFAAKATQAEDCPPFDSSCHFDPPPDVDPGDGDDGPDCDVIFDTDCIDQPPPDAEDDGEPLVTSWVASTADGKRHFFGTTPTSTNQTSRWYLDRQIDALGNIVDYHWTAVELKDFGVVDHTIREIEYTSHKGEGLAPHARVRFQYALVQTCDDSEVPVGASFDYRAGRYHPGTRRLSSIQTEVRDVPGDPWRPVERIQLTYDSDALSCDGPRAPLRILTQVQRTAFAPDGTPTVLPPVLFEYGELDLEYLNHDPGTVGQPFSRDSFDDPLWNSGTKQRLTRTRMDLDGDGLDDLLEVHFSSSLRQCELRARWGRWNGDHDLESIFPLPSLPFPETQTPQSLAKACSLMGQKTDYFNVEEVPPNSCRKGSELLYRFADVDGDGRLDLLTAIHYDETYFDPYLEPDIPNPPVSASTENGLVVQAQNVGPGGGDPCPGPGSGFPDLPDCQPPSPDDPPCVSTERTAQILDPDGDGNGPYVWRIYRNTGNGFAPMPDYPYTLTPVPLAPQGNEGGALGHAHYAGADSAMIDLNGDGRVDLVGGDDWLPDWSVSLGNGRGGFLPTRRWRVPHLDGIEISPSLSEQLDQDTFPRTLGLSGLGDSNADGLPDLLSYDSDADELLVFFNTGTAFHPNPHTLVAGYHTFETISEVGALRTSSYYRTDVDGDGLQDLLDFSGDDGPRFYPNVGDRFLTPPRLLPRPSFWENARRDLILTGSAEEEGYTWAGRTDFTDVDGDGVADMVVVGFFFSDLVARYLISHAVTEGAPPNRLIAVHEGSGRTIRFHYVPAADPQVVRRTAVDDPDVTKPYFPIKLSVVSDVGVEDAHGAAGPGPIGTTTYRYTGPVYGSETGAADEPRRFQGFAKVETTLPLGGRRVQFFDHALPGDGRGQLVEEWSLDEDVPVSVRTSSWQRLPLFDGSPGHTFQTGNLTRTCLPETTVEACREQEANVLRKTYAREPFEDGGQPVLYLASEEAEGEGVAPGDLDRLTSRTFRVDYDADRFLALPSMTELSEAVPGSNATSVRLVSHEETDYDANGLPIEVRVRQDDTRVATTRRTYDPTGNLRTETKPEQVANGGGLSSLLQYDAHKIYVVDRRNELLHIVHSSYDVGTGALLERQGPNLTQLERWTVDGLGRTLERRLSLDGAGIVLVESNSYHDLDQPRRRVDKRLVEVGGPWSTTETTLDGHGRPIRKVDAAGAVSEMDYDAAGSLTAIRSPDPSDDSGTSVEYLYEYDGLSRQIGFSRPDGSTVTRAYQGLFVDVSEDGGDGSGSERTDELDVFSRLVSVEELGGSGGPALTAYRYDARNNVTEIIDADGNLTEITYDLAGRRTAVTRGDRVWRIGYDLNGNVVAQTSPVPAGEADADFTTTTSYDALDRVLVREPARLLMSEARLEQLGIGPIVFAYDDPVAQAIGRVREVFLPFATIRYAYDGRGQVVREERDFVLPPTGIMQQQWIAREYDVLGDPTLTELDDGTVWTVAYDSRGLPANIQWYDPQEDGWRSVARYTRSLARQILARESDFDQTRFLGYDERARQVADEIRGGSSIRAWRSYTYNGMSDLVAVHGATGAWSADAGFAYDALHRVVGAAGPGGYEADVDYTPAGNVATASVNWPGSPYGRDVQYRYGQVDPQAADALVDRSSGKPWARFEYDLAGNVLARHTTHGRFDLAWDGNDQLREVLAPRNGRETYLYDHTGSRFLAVHNGETRVWFGGSETHFARNGRVMRRWIHLSGDGRTVARVRSDDSSDGNRRPPASERRRGPFLRAEPPIELVYSDPLHNQMITLDDDGAPTAAFLYGAFGEVVREVGEGEHRRQFNGKENDDVSGLRYYGARYYDPLLLRWESADPIYDVLPDIGKYEPQRMNLYAFSRNNPLRYFDPDGREDGEVFAQFNAFVNDVNEKTKTLTLSVVNFAIGGPSSQTEGQGPSVEIKGGREPGFKASLGSLTHKETKCAAGKCADVTVSVDKSVELSTESLTKAVSPFVGILPGAVLGLVDTGLTLEGVTSEFLDVGIDGDIRDAGDGDPDFEESVESSLTILTLGTGGALVRSAEFIHDRLD